MTPAKPSPAVGAPGFYETERALSEYLLFHYGSAEEILPWPFGPRAALDYPVRCVSECLDRARLGPQARALDLGCAVGRSSFELARHCVDVIGIDFSQSFIAAARHLHEHGTLAYRYLEEGDSTRPAQAVVPAGVDRSRVRFESGDAQALRPGLGQFDVVLMANLVDRLADPRRCLNRLPELVAPGGQLILTTPCTWLEEFTPRANWLCGPEANGQQCGTLHGLRASLEPHFDLKRTWDLPFLIREHARKFQWSVALGTRWERRTEN
jgi:putative 4-mercaptohistidine N1-methyltranferase